VGCEIASDAFQDAGMNRRQVQFFDAETGEDLPMREPHPDEKKGVPVPLPYAMPGYRPVPVEQLPTSFTLHSSSARGHKSWGEEGGKLVDGTGVAIALSADRPADIYDQTGHGTYRLQSATRPGLFVRHCGMVMSIEPYCARNYDFAWQIMLRDGTTDEVCVWNPHPGDGTGCWVWVDGGRIRITGNGEQPAVFRLGRSNV
jgi:hypothetical protein